MLRVFLYFYQFVIFLNPNTVGLCNLSSRNVEIFCRFLIAFCVFYIIFSFDNHYFACHTIFEDMEP